MKQILKKFLLKYGWFDFIKYSTFISVYQFFFKSEIVRQHKKEILLYKSFLPSCGLIFDIGANDGHKTAAFLAISKMVVCCEPDTHNFHKLRVRFRNRKKRVILVNKALSDQEGQALLYIHRAGSAFNTMNQKWVKILEKDNLRIWNEKIQFSASIPVQLTTLDVLIQKYGNPDFIKIDVEGNELKVLKGLSQKVRWLSFECLLPDFMPELLECIDHLNKLDKQSTYNIILDEKIVSGNFFTIRELFDWLEKTSAHSLEIVVRMNPEN